MDRRLLLHREADALAPCFEAHSRFTALQFAPNCLCALLASQFLQELHVGSGPIIRLFAASHVRNSNKLGRPPIVTPLNAKCPTKNGQYSRLSAIGIQIFVNFRFTRPLSGNETRPPAGPMSLEIH